MKMHKRTISFHHKDLVDGVFKNHEEPGSPFVFYFEDDRGVTIPFKLWDGHRYSIPRGLVDKMRDLSFVIYSDDGEAEAVQRFDFEEELV